MARSGNFSALSGNAARRDMLILAMAANLGQLLTKNQNYLI